MPLKRCLTTLSALVVLATASAAGAQSTGAPRLAKEPPFLGKVSAGGAVNYTFDRTPGQQTVMIDGHKATVHRVGAAANHEFNAILNLAGLRKGRSYSVVITALSRNGKSRLTFRKLMYMHASLNRPVGG
jgi:hypothetical protein